ncbi:putative ABC transporter permease [Candidatus Saccharibacteria bacterium]|nr:putative ABC transporter permease [Candidatus Saccharibacteria bacterium]
MKKIDFVKLFYIFVLGSVVGWVFEGIFTFVVDKQILNHSAVVIGPFDFAYGICAVVLTLLFYRIPKISAVQAFIITYIAGSILEYAMSFGMEKILGFTAWDYTGKFLNINGRICFVFSCFWGLLGILWIKVIYPAIEKLLNKFDYEVANKVALFLLVFLILDTVLTISATNRAVALYNGVEPRNKYERFLDSSFNRVYLKNMYNNEFL